MATDSMDGDSSGPLVMGPRPADQPYKKVEVRNDAGEWVLVLFENLCKGEVFRVIDPPPIGVANHPWVCLEDARPMVDEPNNFVVNCMPEEFSLGFELPAPAAEGFAGDAESLRMLEEMRKDLEAMPEENRKKISGHAAVFRDYLVWTGTLAEMGLALVGAELGAGIKPTPQAEIVPPLAPLPTTRSARCAEACQLAVETVKEAIGPSAAAGVSLNWSDQAFMLTGTMDASVEWGVDPSTPVHSKRVRFSFGERKVEFELLGVECYERVLKLVDSIALLTPLETEVGSRSLQQFVDDARVALPMLKREVPSA